MSIVKLEDTVLARLLVSRNRLERIRPHLRSRPFKGGEFLYHESQPAELLWTVRSGAVRTLKGSSAGRVTALEALGPGDLFGMAVMTEGRGYTESAQGVRAGEVLQLPRRVVTAMLKSDPELGTALLGIIATRLQAAHDRLCSFAHQTVPERMARVVLECREDGRIETTRRLLGESAGTTVETAIRVLRRFEQEGWIEGGIGWIRVIDRAALLALARGDSKDAQSRGAL